MIKVSVIGQGYVGFPLAIHAAIAGNTLVGYDNDKSKISDITQGKYPISGLDTSSISLLIDNNMYTPTYDPTLISKSDIIVLAVPTPLDNNGNPDTSLLEDAARIVAKNCKPTALIINESTSYPGTLRNLVEPIFKSKLGHKLLFASAPERIDPGNINWNLENTPRVVAGLTNEATLKAIDFYQTFCKVIHKASSPEIAEASKLFENTFRMVNIALANEFAIISNNLGFSAYEALTAASTKPFGFMAFYPSIGVGGHCIPIDPKYLSHSAKLAGAIPKLIDLAHDINISMPQNVALRIKTELSNDLLNKKIQLAGVAYKPNIPDLRESPALELIKELRKMGSIVTWHDPVVGKFDNETSCELDPSVDLGLIVTPHEQIDFSLWKNSSVRVLDLSANSRDYGWPKFF
jgi:UDP-N-acetyl-D-glucosamine dehydrogenase